ncbi:hypothetical protein [Roseiterribacter gracilis]|uniref:Proteophosphoglycan ppg4 n=1 Tax=Roseiterribacter gracilis TaxID=2812848 RepID=A0A8S8XEH8_9PROT|nr:hypothetical protein TMPK1_40500 [Rhodospirillales bacterium TMPK1]
MTKFASILAAAGLLVALPAVAQTNSAQPRTTTTGQAPATAPSLSDSNNTSDKGAASSPLANTQGATTATTTNRSGSTGSSAPAMGDANSTLDKSAKSDKSPLANTQGSTGASSDNAATDDTTAKKSTKKTTTKHKHVQSSSADDHMADQLNARVLAGDMPQGTSGSSMPTTRE